MTESAGHLPLILAGLALIVFAVGIGFVMLRGVMRLLFWVVALLASAWAALATWKHVPQWSADWFGGPVPALNVGLPVAVFLVVFVMVRKLVRAVSGAFGGAGGETAEAVFSLGKTLSGLILALVPAVLLWVIGIAVVRHYDSVDELRVFAEGKTVGAPPKAVPTEPRQRSWMERAIPESWMHAIDPSTDPSRVKLAKLVAAGQGGATASARADSKSADVVPRALVVEDPRLQRLAGEGRFAELLRHPMLAKILEDPRVKALLDELKI
jgi:hypothetical protein